MKIALLGATGKTGRYLTSQLCEAGHAVTVIGRDSARLAALDHRARQAVADLENPAAIKAILSDAEAVVSLAHARFAQTVLDALPDGCHRVILTGSTRCFTRLPDVAADAVREGERILQSSGRPGLMLHPSMIYGAPDDRNVNRLLRYIRNWPRFLPALVPLPNGGHHFVQPVFVDDVVAAFRSAIETDRPVDKRVVVAGPEPLTYANMVRQCASALDRRVMIVPLPTIVLTALATLAEKLRLPIPFGASEILRATEDKRFDISVLREQLGVQPRNFSEGIRLKLARGWG